MYMLAAVILGFASIGVFAINNISFDIWTLFWFGLIGFAMRQFGFPLAPMILGVVLGNIAELNLSRAMAIDSDLTIFFTRPWSLFFMTVAVFSALFPWFQSAREKGARWTRFYGPALLVAVTLPLSLMDGWFRPSLAAASFALGCYLGWKALRAMKAA
jgi:putative tricarboxylic transport membrane protein